MYNQEKKMSFGKIIDYFIKMISKFFMEIWSVDRETRKKANVLRPHRPDFQLFLAMVFLLAAGLIVMFSISPQKALSYNALNGTNLPDSHYFILHLIKVGMALGSFIFMAIIRLDWIRKNTKMFFIIGLVSCIVLFVFGVLKVSIVDCTNGACRWFKVPFIGGLQPAEFYKFGALLLLAAFIGMRYKEGKINDWFYTLFPVGLIVAIGALFIIVAQKDMGTGISFISIALTMLFVAKVNTRNMLMIVGACLIAGIIFTVGSPHRMERVFTYLSGSSNVSQDENSYHIKHAKIAIGSGGLFGVGLGNSVQATGYLPEVLNDSIFAVIGEMTGLVGSMLVVILYGWLLNRILRDSMKMSDIWMRLVAVGVFGWIGSHIFVNIGAMVGLIPLTGITLPLLSYGGTSLLVTCSVIGLVFNMSRYMQYDKSNKEVRIDEDSSSGRWFRRSRHASSRSSFRN